MAAMSSLFKSAVLSLSKSSTVGPSIPLRRKVSRVCFTSATRHPQGRSMADDDGKRECSPYNSDETMDEVGETMDKAKQKTQEMKDKAMDSADNMKDKAYDAKERSKERFGSMADKANEMKDKTMDAAENMADSTKHQAHETKEKTKGITQSMGEKAKETVQGAWGAAKDTTQKIKETVVGKSDDADVDDFVEDHVKKPAREKVMDEDVLDARRRNEEERDRKKY